MIKDQNRLPTAIQFDDVETYEHTKLKPVAIPLVVDAKERFIYVIDAASMPAKGHLAALTVKKYGKREDHRPEAWSSVLTMAKEILASDGVTITSDSHTRYPAAIKKILPNATHIQKKSRRACVAGQGELKKARRPDYFMRREDIQAWIRLRKVNKAKTHCLQ